VHILREMGQVLIHGVAIKPGKPVILAMVHHKPVIGLPGYPVSAYIDFENFVKPVMGLYTGESHGAGNQVRAVLSKRLISSLKHKEYVRVKVGKVGDKLVASPLARGAGAAMSLVRADGFCVIEQNSEGYEAGEQVSVELYRSIEEIAHTVVAIGSHDLILDVLADMLPLQSTGVFLSSTHVGSMGGLMALQRKEAHLAPIHLLDEESGVYNETYLKQLFPNQTMVLIKGVRRIQGIMVQQGNPLNIQGIKDLPGCRYVNRQRGAGTRLLFDYQLKKMGIKPEAIDGYEKEAATHMAVAALIQGNGADAGMGIYSAAKAMGLDFIAVGEEEYDFAMEKDSLEIPEIKAFLQVLGSEAFRKRVEELKGYDCRESGRILS
ncbi:MAG: substrate-binding domain-containing protein, partial [Lachnospiraceae bacterium]